MKPGYIPIAVAVIAVIGGLIISTLLNLLVLPAIALRFGRFGPLNLSSK